jgi:hypothetical protein
VSISVRKEAKDPIVNEYKNTPISMMIILTTISNSVLGTISPYPTVVMVVKLQ